MHGKEGLGLSGIDHEQIDQHARDLDLLRRQRAAQRHPLDLGDDDAAGAAGGLRHRDHLAEHRLVFHRDVAILVGAGPSYQRDVNMEGLEKQILLAADGGELDEIFGRPLALPAASEARVDEGLQADVSREAGSACRHFTRQLR